MTEKPTWRAAMTREGWALILLLIALFELCLVVYRRKIQT
jgi:hypothetical protein